VEAGDRDSREEWGWALVLIEFRGHVSHDPELNRRYAALHARTVDQLATLLEQLCARAGVDRVVPPRSMAEFMLAVSHGTRLERATAPDALPTSDLIALTTRALGLDGGTA
jgi:hypothetical protein